MVTGSLKEKSWVEEKVDGLEKKPIVKGLNNLKGKRSHNTRAARQHWMRVKGKNKNGVRD